VGVEVWIGLVLPGAGAKLLLILGGGASSLSSFLSGTGIAGLSRRDCSYHDRQSARAVGSQRERFDPPCGMALQTFLTQVSLQNSQRVRRSAVGGQRGRRSAVSVVGGR
jgi:hypothetical protein